MKTSRWLAAVLICLLNFGVANVCLADQMFDPKKLSINDVNLSTQKFFDAFSSADPAEREKAKLYLLGVLDSSEGQQWCKYSSFKTITIYEVLWEGKKTLSAQQISQRASKTITQILSSRLPCKK